MIKELSEYEITSRDGPFINVECNAKIINTLVRKINELVDAVNAIQKEREAVRKSVNIHEKQIDELQMKVNKLEEKVNFAQPEVKENVQDKFVETHKILPKKLTMLLLTDTMSTILQEFYEKVLAEQKD